MTKRVAVLGLGTRGAAFVRAFHGTGWSVTGFDPDPVAGSEISLPRDWRRHGTISETVARADWIVLCLPDRPELLRKVIQRAQSEASDTAIVAVVTHETDAETVQGCAMRPGQVLRLGIDPSGGLIIDTTPTTSGTARSEAQGTLAMIAATGSFAPDATKTNADQAPDAESA